MARLWVVCVASLLIVGCSKSSAPTKTGPAAAEKPEANTGKSTLAELETREGFEKYMAEQGIEVMPGLVFEKVHKAKAEQSYVITFKFEGGTVKENLDKFVAFYTKNYEEKMRPKGWTLPVAQPGGGILMYVAPARSKISGVAFTAAPVAAPGAAQTATISLGY
jgi:hypothetical protein